MKTEVQAVIVDTSALISLLIDTDQNHQLALEAISNLTQTDQTVLIPHDVFTECLNTLGKKFGHKQTILASKEILTSSFFEIANPSEDLRKLALSKFELQSGSVSFTDCIVMALADLSGTKKIFGFDKVFKKNGYQIF